MLIRTHLAFIVGIIFLFISRINNKLTFVIVALLATLLPDIDSGFSTAGKFKGFKILQFFVKHRGVIHSFTFCIVVSLLLAVFWPIASLAFFLGYGLHLFLDSFTKEGIMLFYPYRKRSSGPVKVGSLTESSLFLFLILADIFLFFAVLSAF